MTKSHKHFKGGKIFDILCKRLQSKRVVFELNAFHISIHIILGGIYMTFEKKQS